MQLKIMSAIGVYENKELEKLLTANTNGILRTLKPDEVTIRRGMGSQTPVAHTCNPSYSGGRDQEDGGLKPAWANSL
jgi:hypothetical protein